MMWYTMYIISILCSMFNKNEKILHIFDVFSYALVLVSIAVSALFFDRGFLNAYVLPKQYLFIGLLLVQIIIFSTRTILLKKIHFRKTVLDAPLFGVVISALASALLSMSKYDSFLGRSEYFVFNFVFLFFLVIFYFILINVLFTPERWRGVLDALLLTGLASSALFIFKTVFGVSPGLLSGVWNVVDGTNSAFGLWLVPVFIIAAGSLIKKNVSVSRALFYFFAMLMSLAVFLIMGFQFFWWVILTGLALLLLLGVSFLQDAKMGWLSVLFSMLILCAVFIIFGSPKSLQTAIPAEISLDTKPSWLVTKNVLFDGAKNFLLGSGLGTFGYDFSQFRTSEFNYHPTAWSLRFSQPVNSFFALVAEGGVLLGLGFLFIIMFVLGHVFSTWFKARGTSFGISASLSMTKNNMRIDVFLSVVAWLVASLSLMVSFYNVALWVLWWLLLAMVISGLSLLGHTVVKEKIWTLEDSPQYNLAFSFAMIVTMAVVVMVGVLGLRFYIADTVFARALQEPVFTDAEKTLQQAISLRSKSDIYHTALANVYLKQAGALAKTSSPDVQEVAGLLAKAVAEAKIATEISPNSVAIWENLATMYENTAAIVPDAAEWSIKSLMRASELEPTNAVLVWKIGNMYATQNNLSKAIEYYQKSIALKKDYAEAYVSLSNVYELNKETDKAIEIYKNFAQLGMNANPEMLFNFGRILYNRGGKDDRKDAEKLWLEAVRLQPSYSNALYSLGLLYENRGDKTKALEYYYKVKDLNPGNKDILEKIKALVSGSN